MKKNLFAVLLCFVLVLSLSACRKNSAKNLQIESHKGSTYVIKSIATDLAFGDMYFTIKDEALTSIHCTYDAKKYKLSKYYVKIGDYVEASTYTSADGVTDITLSTPYRFVSGKDSDGYEILNTQTIVMYVSFVDINTDNSDYEGDLVAPSSVTVTTNATDLIEFIRNKEIKKNPNTTTAS